MQTLESMDLLKKTGSHLKIHWMFKMKINKSSSCLTTLKVYYSVVLLMFNNFIQQLLLAYLKVFSRHHFRHSPTNSLSRSDIDFKRVDLAIRTASRPQSFSKDWKPKKFGCKGQCTNIPCNSSLFQLYHET